MTSDQDVNLYTAGTGSSDSEVRLENSREALRQRLNQQQSDNPSTSHTDLGRIARIAAPLARHWIRQNPYASLSAAALTGMVLMRWKPWRGLGGSLLAGLLTRQALAASRPLGKRAFTWLLDSAFGKSGVSNRPLATPSDDPRLSRTNPG